MCDCAMEFLYRINTKVNKLKRKATILDNEKNTLGKLLTTIALAYLQK